MQLAVIPVSLNFKRLSFTVEKIGHPLAHGREYSTVLRPLVGVPECLDALQDFVLHLEFIEIHLEWVEHRNAGDVFLGPGKSGEVVRRHVGSLFVLYHEVMLQ